MLRLGCNVLQNEIGLRSKLGINQILSQICSKKFINSICKLENNADVVECDIKSNKNCNLKSDKHLTKHYREIMDYLDSKQSLKDILPKLKGKYLKKRFKYPDAQFLVDKDIAIEMVKAIKSELLKSDSHIFELNPGPGLITEQLLLLNKLRNLRLYENDTKFIPDLNALIILNGKRVPVIHFNFLHVGNIIYQDNLDGGTRLNNIMKNVSRKKWDDSPVMTIIGVQPPTLGQRGNLIKHLIFSIIFQNGLTVFGRPRLYLVMHPAVYLQLTSDSSTGYMLYRASSVFFRLFFETKVIKKIPRNSVVPWCFKYVLKKKSKLRKVNNVDSDKMYFVELTPRADLFSFIRPDLLKPFWYFVRYHFFSRKNKLIPCMERWIPGCGPRLIAEGFTIFTEFGELSPSELLKVFNLFSSWPEFNSCPFLASMETTLLKLESAGNEDALQDEDIDDNVEDQS